MVTVVATVALSAAIAGPASAEPPTFYGAITCDAYGLIDREMSGIDYWTKKSIAAYKRNSPNMQDCEKGSVGFKAYPEPE